MTDVQRAARFYYLQRQGFGGKYPPASFGTAATTPPKLNLLRLEEDLSAAHIRLSTTTIERLEWSECIRRYDRAHTLFFLDPPYWGTQGYGIQFPFEEYAKIAKVIGGLKGKAVVTVNDIPEMRAAFKGFRSEKVSLRYTRANVKRPERSELIIRSW